MADDEKVPEKKIPKHNDLSEAARVMGRVAGRKGGPARDAALSHEEKVRIAKMGAAAKHAKDHATKKKIVKKARKKKGG